MNPAFRFARAFVGALHFKFAIDSVIIILVALERIRATMCRVSTVDLGNQVGIVADQVMTPEGMRLFMLVCKTGGIYFKFFTFTVPVE